MHPSIVLASAVNTDSDRLTAATWAAGTETIIPVYAFIPQGAWPSFLGTVGGPAAMLEWNIAGTSTVTSGGAADTFTLNMYYGATPGTGTKMTTTPATFILPMNAASGFSLRIAAQTTVQSSATAVQQRCSVTSTLIYSPTSGTSSTSVVQAVVNYGTVPTGDFTADRYIWWTVTGSGTASGAVTFVDFRSVTCIAHGLKPLGMYSRSI